MRAFAEKRAQRWKYSRHVEHEWHDILIGLRKTWPIKNQTVLMQLRGGVVLKNNPVQDGFVVFAKRLGDDTVYLPLYDKTVRMHDVQAWARITRWA